MANSVVNQIKVGSTTYDMKPYLNSATSGDSTTATAWTDVSTAIANTDSYDTVFNKVTKMVRNVRYLYNKLGTTDFSAVGSTTSAALIALNEGKSDTDHTHSQYATTGHSHSNYSTTGHTHSNYSTTGHTHSNYASSTHNHDSAYAAKSHTHSNYSLTTHTHSDYSTTGHTHSNYSTTGHTHAYIATSNIVTSQTNSTTKVPAASLCYAMNQAYQTDLTNVTNGKSSIATAITDKGVSTSATDTFATMAANIAAINANGSMKISTTYTKGSGFRIEFDHKPNNYIMWATSTDYETSLKTLYIYVNNVVSGLQSGTYGAAYGIKISGSATTSGTSITDGGLGKFSTNVYGVHYLYLNTSGFTITGGALLYWD